MFVTGAVTKVQRETLKSQFISEMVSDMPSAHGHLPCVTDRKSSVVDRHVSVPVSLSDLERDDAMGQIIPEDHLCNYARAVSPRTRKFGVVTPGVGWASFHRASHVPVILGWDAVPQNFWEFLHARTRYENQ